MYQVSHVNTPCKLYRCIMSLCGWQLRDRRLIFLHADDYQSPKITIAPRRSWIIKLSSTEVKLERSIVNWLPPNYPITVMWCEYYCMSHMILMDVLIWVTCHVDPMDVWWVSHGCLKWVAWMSPVSHVSCDASTITCLIWFIWMS